MTDPRPVTLSMAGIMSLTVLEAARAQARARIKTSEVRRILVDLNSGNLDPEDQLRGVELIYAYALELERREAPETTWTEAQTWRVTVDLETRDELADAEAAASVDAAVVTGLPPAEAGQLTIAQMDEYRAIGEERERVMKAARARRSG